jgi:hypothetical protein
MLGNDPERFRGHDSNLNPGGEFIFLPVFLRRLNSHNVHKGHDGLTNSVLVSVVHFVTFVRDNVSS